MRRRRIRLICGVLQVRDILWNQIKMFCLLLVLLFFFNITSNILSPLFVDVFGPNKTLFWFLNVCELQKIRLIFVSGKK